MAGIICKGGLSEFFTSKLLAVDPVNWHVRLYQNNHVPALLDVVGAYTECTYSGYAAQAIGTVPGLTWDGTNSRWLAIWFSLVFSDNGGGVTNNVYGYYVTDTSGALVWADQIDSPPATLGNNNTPVVVQPTLSEANG